MIMVTGGSFQNKTAYALKVTGLMETDIIDGAECTEKDALEAKGIRNYHTFIKRFFLNYLRFFFFFALSGTFLFRLFEV